MEAGEVTFLGEEPTVAEAPEGCHESVRDERQRVVDISLEVNIEKAYEGWLGEQLEVACTDQAGEIQSIVDTLGATRSSRDADKSQAFAAWSTLEAGEGQDVAVFQSAQLIEFNKMYNEGLIPVVDQGIGIPVLPDKCGEIDRAFLAIAEALVGAHEREASLCAWLDS